MLTNIGLVQYAKNWLNYSTRYGWGCWGQPITDSIIASKSRQYPEHYDRSRRVELVQLIGKAWLIDCVGLIKGYYWGMTPGGSKIEYVAKTDVSADDMYYRATKKGPLHNMPERLGICVQLPGHIGIYIGNGKVIESTRGIFGDGVVMTNLSDRNWTHWLECPYITYVEGSEEEMTQEQFNQMYANMIAEKKGDKPSSWAEDACEEAKTAEVFAGDGKGNFNWQDPVSREALAVIFKKVGLLK